MYDSQHEMLVETIRQRHTVTHDRKEETIEAKVRWFQSLSLTERMELLCQFTDMILSVNPQIVDRKDAQPLAGYILVLSKA